MFGPRSWREDINPRADFGRSSKSIPAINTCIIPGVKSCILYNCRSGIDPSSYLDTSAFVGPFPWIGLSESTDARTLETCLRHPPPFPEARTGPPSSCSRSKVKRGALRRNAPRSGVWSSLIGHSINGASGYARHKILYL